MASVAGERKVYEMVWRNKFLTGHCTTIGEMADALAEATAQLRAMEAAGVMLEDGGQEDDYAMLVTGDPEVAKRFDMQEVEYGDGGE